MDTLWIIALISVSAIMQATASSWSYKGAQGPKNWHKHYPDCKKNNQSPIDIPTSDTEFEQARLGLTGYSQIPKYVDFTLINNGHTAQVTLENVDPYATFASVFGQRFKPWQIHFHWGSRNGVGSEHKVDGRQFPAEMHFVHVNTKYSDTKEALKHQDGLLVLGTFFEISKRGNAFLGKILKYLPEIEYAEQNVSIPALRLRTCMAHDKNDFMFYEGSLTTPGCNQAVLWIVFDETVSISEEQIEMFRDLKHIKEGEEEGKSVFMSNNFRPTQPINDRPLYRNVHDEDDYDNDDDDDDDADDRN